MLEAQLRVVIEAIGAGQSVREALLRSQGATPEIEAERQAAGADLEATLRDLVAMRDALGQLQLPEEEQPDLREQLQLSVQRCEDEIRILRRPSPLGDVPEYILAALADARTKGCLPGDSWDGGLSPMHWAAQNGRHDVVDFFLGQPGGVGHSMIGLRDRHGKTPLFYAEHLGKATVAQSLRAHSDTAAPPSPGPERRPETGGMSPAYLRVLEQVETQGWDTVTWKDGYTLLHWASTKGHSDLCTYLLGLKADPDTCDKFGRTPLACARENGYSDVARVLEDVTTVSSRPPASPEAPPAPPPVPAAAGRRGTHLGVSESHRSVLDHQGAAAMGSKRASLPQASSKRTSLPPAYLGVMEQIDRLGWDKMHWARGFTLLHWAAQHDQPELCARFLAQRADPGKLDDTGSSALDYARGAGSAAAVRVLEEHM